MQFKLISRTEMDSTIKTQLQFQEVVAATTVPATMGQTVQLNGFFDPTYAASLTVGATYDMTLTQV